MPTKVINTSRTCAREIHVEYDENMVITSCKFVGGCPGNTHGVANLVVGRKISDIVPLLEGIDCGGKGTSCPDQLARGLKDLL